MVKRPTSNYVIFVIILFSHYGLKVSGTDPFDCDFDDGFCNWRRFGMFDWTWGTGATPTPHTGPDADHTSGVGAYAYIDTSSKEVHPGANALLLSPKHLPGTYCFSLWYNMYGRHVRGLAIWEHHTKNSVLFVIWRNQGKGWKFGRKRFTATKDFTISIQGLVRKSAQHDFGDIAVDDIEMLSGDCPKDCGTRIIENGQFRARYGTILGKMATQFCDYGYTLTGDRTVFCTEDGWNGTTTTCDAEVKAIIAVYVLVPMVVVALAIVVFVIIWRKM